MCRDIVAKQKPCEENVVAIYNIFFIKTYTKLNLQPAQYEKNWKWLFWGKKSYKKTNHIGKHCNNSQYCFFK